MDHCLNDHSIELFRKTLMENEKGELTIRKYIRDVERFRQWLGDDDRVNKARVIQYKKELKETYKISSANSIISALNTFFADMGWEDCHVKTYKVQHTSFRSRGRELSVDEYYRLLDSANRRGDSQIYFIMETIASTGIRVSELPFVTVEALSNRKADVSLKGKTREVLLPSELCSRLDSYARSLGIRSGSVFVTRTGTPVDRSNVLHKMKACGKDAGVPLEKVYPHNLRHLFAVTYYEMEKDIAHLADLLGHTNINTTRIYTMISPDDQLSILEKMWGHMQAAHG